MSIKSLKSGLKMFIMRLNSDLKMFIKSHKSSLKTLHCTICYSEIRFTLLVPDGFGPSDGGPSRVGRPLDGGAPDHGAPGSRAGHLGEVRS